MKKLTKREYDVLRLIAFSNPEIAKKLGVERTTVVTHLNSLRFKYLATSKIQVLIEGLKRGDIKISDVEMEEK